MPRGLPVWMLSKHFPWRAGGERIIAKSKSGVLVGKTSWCSLQHGAESLWVWVGTASL